MIDIKKKHNFDKLRLILIKLRQCEVSDQIQNKKSDQMFKSELKMLQRFIDKIKSEQIINKICLFILLRFKRF